MPNPYSSSVAGVAPSDRPARKAATLGYFGGTLLVVSCMYFAVDFAFDTAGDAIFLVGVFAFTLVITVSGTFAYGVACWALPPVTPPSAGVLSALVFLFLYMSFDLLPLPRIPFHVFAVNLPAALFTTLAFERMVVRARDSV